MEVALSVRHTSHFGQFYIEDDVT